MWFPQVAVQQSSGAEHPVELGRLYRESDVNFAKDFIEPLLAGLFGAALRVVEFGADRGRGVAHDEGAFEFLKHIQGFAAAPGLACAAATGLILDLKGQNRVERRHAGNAGRGCCLLWGVGARGGEPRGGGSACALGACGWADATATLDLHGRGASADAVSD